MPRTIQLSGAKKRKLSQDKAAKQIAVVAWSARIDHYLKLRTIVQVQQSDVAVATSVEADTESEVSGVHEIPHEEAQISRTVSARA